MNNIKIIVSTALVDRENIPLSHIDQRLDLSLSKRYEEYEESLNIIKSFKYDFIILETVSEFDPFLEKYGNVFYSKVNNSNYRNRGTNYVMALKKILSTMKFDDNDLIIHITGRYPLVDNSFIEYCKEIDKNTIGCFKKDSINQFYLFLYSLRFKKLKNIIDSIDISDMEINKFNLEKIFSNYLSNDKVEFVERLGIIGKQSNSPNNLYGKTIY